MKQKKRGFFRRVVGFTLLELMVSMVVLALLMLVVFNMLEPQPRHGVSPLKGFKLSKRLVLLLRD